MSNAIEVFYYIFSKVVNLLFNQIQIAEGVAFGWVLITIFVFTIVIRSILNIPSSIPRKDSAISNRGRKDN